MEKRDLKKWIPEFLSTFHKAVMRPQGYRKDGRKFYKDKGEYRERIYFQGSPMLPYSFYINVGVEFKDIQDYDCCRTFVLIPCTHWAVRIDEIVPDAPSQWIVQEDSDPEKLSESLHALLLKASETINAGLEEIRREVDIRLQKRAEYLQRLEKQ